MTRERAFAILSKRLANWWKETLPTRTLCGGDHVSEDDFLVHSQHLPPGQAGELLNLPRQKVMTSCEIAECRAASQAQLEPKLITPQDVVSSLRAGERVAADC